MVEASQVDAIDALATLDFGEVGHERAVRVELVGPDRGDEEDPLVTEIPGQEGKKVSGGRIGPLEILDDDDDRSHLGESVEDPEHEFEEPDLREAIVRDSPRRSFIAPVARPLHRDPVRTGADLRHEPCQFATARPEEGRKRSRIDLPEEGAKGLDEGSVRQPAGAQEKTATDEDPPARGDDAIAESLDEACLADPGLPGDDDHAGFAGPGTRIGPGKPFQLRRPPDECLTLSAVHEAAMIGASTGAVSCPALDKLEREDHAVMPISSSRVRSRPRARHNRVRVAGPERPVIRAISAER